jgi:hypothetical protein
MDQRLAQLRYEIDTLYYRHPWIMVHDYVTDIASLVRLDRRMFIDFPICFASSTSTPPP